MTKKQKADTRLIGDVISKITKKKAFGEVDYKIYNAYPSKKEADKDGEKLIEWSHKQSSPSLSRRFKPIVYDTTWKGRHRFKLYIPAKWFIHNVRSC